MSKENNTQPKAAAIALPTVAQLKAMEIPNAEKLTILKKILNQQPPAQWIRKNNGIPYLPISKVELMLRTCFDAYRVEIKSVTHIVNSIMIHVTLHVLNPITGIWENNDGIGASPIQTKSGAGAIDWTQVANSAVQMSAPSAESYAIKDAAEKFGRIFGSDIARKN